MKHVKALFLRSTILTENLRHNPGPCKKMAALRKSAETDKRICTALTVIPTVASLGATSDHKLGNALSEWSIQVEENKDCFFLAYRIRRCENAGRNITQKTGVPLMPKRQARRDS
jgi:hypothetical protein